MEDLYLSIFNVQIMSQQQQQMDDLLKKIKKLSAQIKSDKSEDARSSKEDTIQPPSAKKISRKRQKNRNKKRHNRKRQLKNIPDIVDSSSYTDCTDEDILRDYIENITANMSGSDTDITLRKGSFLVKHDFASPLDFPTQCHAEIDETDSVSESLLLNHSKKKRRKHVNKKSIEHAHTLNDVCMEEDGISKLDKVIKKQYLGSTSNKMFDMKIKKVKLLKTSELDEDVDMDETSDVNSSLQDSSQTNSSSDNNSETSTNSNSPGSEADDEGEESCAESLHIKPVIPWWEDADKTNILSSEEINIENSLSLIRERCEELSTTSRYTIKHGEPKQVLLETGGFVAFANHKIKKFVHHRDSNELSLYSTNKKEQGQVTRLAKLYELQCIVEDANKISNVVLTKTSSTKDADKQALKSFLSHELKLRYRKNHPRTNWNPKKRKITVPPTEHMDIPLPDANVGHQMLRMMGWKPGQGLGKESTGILNPVKAVKRPKQLGFGHP